MRFLFFLLIFTQILRGQTGLPSSTTGQGAVGDCKSGMQASDHLGWVKLDGRLKSTLTAGQQANATTLGIGTNIPNATGRVYAQGTLGAQIGSNLVAQNNLPNVSISTTTDGNHSHTTGINNSLFNGSANGGERFLNNGGVTLNSNITSNFASNTTGAHTHTIALNGGVAQQTYIPAAIGVNMFMYLGN
jgi:hypothetical protein